MKDEKLQSGINDIKKVVMSTDEKERILKYVLNSTVPSKKFIESPWKLNSFVLAFQRNRFAYYGIMACLIIVLSSGVVFAAEDSLPDSILYPIKVNVVEPIRAALITSPVDKAQYESSLATTRLIEAETLALQGKLDSSKEKQLSNLIRNHSKALNNTIDQINQTSSSNQTDEIITNFNAKMNAHAQVLDIIKGQNNNIDSQSQNIQNDQGNQRYQDNQISRTARDNATIVKHAIKKDVKNARDEYNKKKVEIQSLIDSTNNDINNAGPNTSSLKQKIINDTHRKLNQAAQYLQDATNNEQIGDSQNADSALLNSESSVKEANIFLKAGLKFKGNFDGLNSDN